MSFIIAGVAKAAAVAAKVAKAVKVGTTLAKGAKAVGTAQKIGKGIKTAQKIKGVADKVKKGVDTLKGPKSTPPPSGAAAGGFASMKFDAGSPAEYSPYKMRGHALPGIKQSPAKAALLGNQNNLPTELKEKIKRSPARNKNLLNAVPDKKTFDSMSKINQEAFNKAAAKSGTIPMMTSKKSPATMYDKKSPAKNYKKGYYGA